MTISNSILVGLICRINYNGQAVKKLALFNCKDTSSLVEVLKKWVTRKWAFSNMVSMLSSHIMSNIDAIKFLNNPEKAWSEKNKATRNLYVK